MAIMSRIKPALLRLSVAGLISIAPLALSSSAPTEHGPAAAARVQWMGNIQMTRLNESSGLASSQQSSQILWSINDSGSGPEIFALTPQGQHLGSWLIDMPKPVDWEAMASFQWQDKGYLLVADIGDNFATRSSVSYSVIPEPDLAQIGTQERLSPLFTQHFTYPEGPRDAEAVAVDMKRRELLILSKRTQPPELYRLPLSMAAANADQARRELTAQRLAALTGFTRPAANQADLYGRYWAYLGMPTGMTLSGDRLLVTTMEHAYVFNRQRLDQPGQRVDMPLAGQREAITFAKDSATVAYVSHEREDGMRQAAIYRLELPR